MPVQLRAHGVLVYKERDRELVDNTNLQLGREKLTTRGYNGEMSVKTRSKVRRYVTNWLTTLNAANGNAFACLEAQRHRLVFITLTLPAKQMHDDNHLKRHALAPFMQELRRRFGVENHLWRIEPQQNGNAHFHVLADQHVPAKELQKLWNQQMRKLGYIEAYRRNQEAWHSHGFRPRPELYRNWSISKQKAAYKLGKSQNWARPNTTDIHALRNVQNVTAYVVKYMSKGGAARKVDGRLWGCNDEIRNLEGITLADSSELFALLQEEVNTGDAAILEGDGFSFYKCQTRTLLEKWFPGASDIFTDHYREQSAKLSGIHVYLHSSTKPPPPPCQAPKKGT